MSKEDNKNSQERKKTKALERRSDRDFQPHMAPNYLINTLLRDSLRNNLPPDFRARILGRLQIVNQTKTGESAAFSLSSTFTTDNLDEALGAAMADVNFADSAELIDELRQENNHQTGHHAKSLVRAYQPPDVIRVEPRFWHYKNFRLAFAGSTIAASILGGWFAFRSQSDDIDPSLATKESRPQPSSSLKQEGGDQPHVIEPARSSNESMELLAAPAPSSRARPMPDGNSSVAHSPRGQSPDPRSPISPSALSPSAAAIAAENLFSKPQSLPTNDLVAIVNSQIEMTWDKAKLTLSKSVADDQWLARVTQIATGRAPTAAEQEAFRADKSENRLQNIAERLTSTKDFNVHWSKLLAEHYLDKTIPSVKAQPHNVQQFIAWLQDGLQNSSPISLMETSVLFPDATPGSSSTTLWFGETINRELLTAKERERNSKLVYKYDAADAPIVNLTSNALHRSGFSSASCVQCHNSGDKALDFVASDNAINSKQFWSMSAYVMDTSAKSGLHRSNSSNELFYEDEIGRVTVAPAKFSVEVAGNSQTVDLKDWFTHNPSARNGLVELVWKNVFFQPLVPDFGLAETEALEERQDLKRLLASQLQATGNLQKLITSLLLVDALKSTDAAVTTRWYLRAQNDVLSVYHLRSRLFAFVPAPARQIGTIRTSRNNEVLAWVKGTHFAKSHSQLAQPDTGVAKQSGGTSIQSPFLQQSAPKLPELDPSQLLYAISLAKPYSRLSEYATRVSNSKLQWQDQVHHAYWLTDGRMATTADLAGASEIYSQNENNPQKSLVEILVGLSGSY